MLITFRKIKTYIVELLNDFTDFRIIIVKSYLKESNTSIESKPFFKKKNSQKQNQDSIQDSKYQNQHKV